VRRVLGQRRKGTGPLNLFAKENSAGDEEDQRQAG
jgi:hypothetical protein